ncbi:unnamed protein product [Rangifer tarandus platyrhynchus]|uniref:Uncharacterized protein n=1 Tax=Rangifer tarandus platyrhynchus TaxID=3082113 RepID=A0AC59YB18_RANTA
MVSRRSVSSPPCSPPRGWQSDVLPRGSDHAEHGPTAPYCLCKIRVKHPRVANAQANLVPNAPSSTLSPGGFASPSTPASLA